MALLAPDFSTGGKKPASGLHSSWLPVSAPVLIDITVDGQSYDEMHVDGGVKAQVFMHAAILNFRDAAREITGDGKSRGAGRIYIIFNSQLSPQPGVVPRTFEAIAGQSLLTMMRQAGINDLYRIFAFSRREELDFNYIAVPENFKMNNDETFDPEEMKRLFEIEQRLAVSGNAWRSSPPGLFGDE